MKYKIKNHIVSDKLSQLYSWISIATVVAVCLFIILIVFYLGYDVISLRFLTQEPNPSALYTDNGGILTPMIGTIILTIIGVIIALPLSLCAAIYLCFYAKQRIFQNLVNTAIDILSGVPTIVIALFALAIFTLPQFGFLSTTIEMEEGDGQAFGRSFLVAGITMAIMVLPFITKAIVQAIQSVPESYIESSYSLGASKWYTITNMVLFCARPGIITGTTLGMGRIIGDTAIVWLALGGTLRMTGIQPWFLPQNWLSTLRNTGSTLTTYIYYASPAGEGDNYEVAFGASFVLIVIIVLLNAITAIIGNAGMKGNS